MPSYNHRINTRTRNNSTVDHTRKPRPTKTSKPTSIHTVNYNLADQLISLATTYKENLSTIMRDYNKCLSNTNLDHLSNHVSDYLLATALTKLSIVNLLTNYLDIACPFQYQLGNYLVQLIKLRLSTITSILTNKHPCSSSTCKFYLLPIRTLLADNLNNTIDAITSSSISLIYDSQSLILDYIEQSNSNFTDLLTHIEASKNTLQTF